MARYNILQWSLKKGQSESNSIQAQYNNDSNKSRFRQHPQSSDCCKNKRL